MTDCTFVHEDRRWCRDAGRAVGLAALLMLAISAVGGAATESNYLIIVHRDNPKLSLPRAELDAIYLGKINHWPGGKEIILVNHRDDGIRNDFSLSIHARPESAVNAYWAAKTFKDAVVPPARMTDNEIVAFVADNPGAIGYVSSGTSLQGVKRIEVDD